MAAISDRACRYIGVDFHKQTITIAVVEGTQKQGSPASIVGSHRDKMLHNVRLI